MASIHALFRQLRQVGASDLHLVAGRPPMLRTSGHVAEMQGQAPISDADLREMLAEIVSDRQWRRFERDHDLDFATAVEGVARFRGNYFEQQHGVGAVFRMVPDKIIEIENL